MHLGDLDEHLSAFEERLGQSLGEVRQQARRDQTFNTILKTNMVLHLLLGGLGWLLGGRFGAGNTPQDHSFYTTKSQPDRPRLTPIREGFWLGSWAF